MALRILTGIINTDAPTGEVVIKFKPHGQESASPAANFTDELTTIGPDKRFSEIPAKFVALRDLAIQTKDVNAILGGLENDFSESCRVNDSIDRDRLTVSWNSDVDTSKAFIRIMPREISYLVIGLVPD